MSYNNSRNGKDPSDFARFVIMGAIQRRAIKYIVSMGYNDVIFN